MVVSIKHRVDWTDPAIIYRDNLELKQYSKKYFENNPCLKNKKIYKILNYHFLHTNKKLLYLQGEPKETGIRIL